MENIVHGCLSDERVKQIVSGQGEKPTKEESDHLDDCQLCGDLESYYRRQKLENRPPREGVV